MYEYKCYTTRVVDGNTVDALIDLGFNVLIKQRIKLYGVYTYDSNSSSESEKLKAIEAKNKLIEYIGKEFICQTIMNKRGKVGRTLGQIFVEDESGSRIDINQKLIDEGFASKYGE
jgi:micrococcal nuclease